jgi:hypothetical protein
MEQSAFLSEKSIYANSPPRRSINSRFQSRRCKKDKNSKKHTILLNPSLPHCTTPRLSYFSTRDHVHLGIPPIYSYPLAGERGFFRKDFFEYSF